MFPHWIKVIFKPYLNTFLASSESMKILLLFERGLSPKLGANLLIGTFVNYDSFGTLSRITRETLSN
jgi:hypothetical protein